MLRCADGQSARQPANAQGVSRGALLAHVFTAIFRQTTLPDVLLLIVIGLCLGPLLALVTPADFGAVGPIFTTVTLIILLFKEGSGMSLAVLRQSVRGTLPLLLTSFLVCL